MTTCSTDSLASRLGPAALTEAASDADRDRLRHLWRFWARPQQIAPDGAWFAWLILAGRGFGKTRAGAEWVRERVERGGARRIALVGRSAADVRDVMVNGESGLVAIAPPWNRPRYVSTTRAVLWPNGAVATLYSAEEPDQLRGPQHDTAWADELAAWSYPETWDQLMLGLRLSRSPRVVVTTTPRPTKIIRGLVKQAPSGRVAVTRGSTFDNAANLPAAFLDEIRSRYEGTRLGRQELHAEILDDTPGALWTRAQLEAAWLPRPPDLVRVVVAIDPSVGIAEGSDEAGLVVAGKGADGRAYVLADYSARLSPDAWAAVATRAYRDHRADLVVAEANNGGEMVGFTLRTHDRHVPVKLVHASRGKRTRAEPIAALYEQRKVSHVGALPKLEDEMCTWAGLAGDPSPNRVDALVWALTELMLGRADGPVARAPVAPDEDRWAGLGGRGF